MVAFYPTLRFLERGRQQHQSQLNLLLLFIFNMSDFWGPSPLQIAGSPIPEVHLLITIIVLTLFAVLVYRIYCQGFPHYTPWFPTTKLLWASSWATSLKSKNIFKTGKGAASDLTPSHAGTTRQSHKCSSTLRSAMLCSDWLRRIIWHFNPWYQGVWSKW